MYNTYVNIKRTVFLEMTICLFDLKIVSPTRQGDKRKNMVNFRREGEKLSNEYASETLANYLREMSVEFLLPRAAGSRW